MAASTITVIVNMRYHKPDVVCDRSSIFGNPYRIDRDGTRDDVCDKFVEYFKTKLHNPKFHAKVLSLKGKRLGCWCKCSPPCNNPKCISKSYRCHLETILEYLERYK